jgi:monoamine oxidase
MRPAFEPELSDPPRNPDVAVVGAGAAGIAAARACLAAGLSVAVLEARHRVGGRAVTVMLKGHPVDLGAHWLHSASANPLVRLAYGQGEPLREAPRQGHLYIRGRRASRAEKRDLDRAFVRVDRELARHARKEQDRSAASVLPGLGPWRERVATVHGLVSGRPLDEVSVKDYSNAAYTGNRFIAGGLGAYLARHARGLPIGLCASVEGIDLSGRGVVLDTSAGRLAARAAIVTVSPLVLQRGAIRFTPELPGAIAAAIEAFLGATYEHVVLHWPSAPFDRADRLAALLGTRHRPPGMLTRIDGTPFHYLELDHPTAVALDTSPLAPARFARDVLREHFGARAIRDLAVPAVTGWRHDRFSAGSWSVAPPHRHMAREIVKTPVAEKLWFAGEFASRSQWGTVGGAWEEGERAAGEVARALGQRG